MRTLVRGVTETGRVLVGHPLVGVAVVATAVLAAAGALAAGRVPVVGGVAYLVVVQPVVLAGLLHVGNTAVTEKVGGRTYLDGVRHHALGLLGAFLLTGLVFALLGGLALVVVFMVGFTGTIGLTPGLVVAAAPVAVTAVALQFVDASVVVDGDGVRGAVEHSWEALVHHPATVLGYTAVRLISVGLLVAGARVLLGGPRLTDPRLGGVDAVVVAVALCVVGYLGTVLHVVLYRELAR